MFKKQEILARKDELLQEALANGDNLEEAQLNVAMIIAGCAFYGKKQRSGEDFSEHAVTVTAQHQSKYKRIISILHDVIEDSDWTLQEIRDMGFSERVLKALDAVTKRDGEQYFDFIERCSLAGEDAIQVKIADLKHNSDPTRYRHITESRHQELKAKAYNVAYHYLVDILKVRADPEADYNAPGRSIVDYMLSREGYKEHPRMANKLLREFSSRSERLPIPLKILGQHFSLHYTRPLNLRAPFSIARGEPVLPASALPTPESVKARSPKGPGQSGRAPG